MEAADYQVGFHFKILVGGCSHGRFEIDCIFLPTSIFPKVRRDIQILTSVHKVRKGGRKQISLVFLNYCCCILFLFSPRRIMESHLCGFPRPYFFLFYFSHPKLMQISTPQKIELYFPKIRWQAYKLAGVPV